MTIGGRSSLPCIQEGVGRTRLRALEDQKRRPALLHLPLARFGFDLSISGEIEPHAVRSSGAFPLRHEQQDCCRKDWHSPAIGALLSRPGA